MRCASDDWLFFLNCDCDNKSNLVVTFLVIPWIFFVHFRIFQLFWQQISWNPAVFLSYFLSSADFDNFRLVFWLFSSKRAKKPTFFGTFQHFKCFLTTVVGYFRWFRDFWQQSLAIPNISSAFWQQSLAIFGGFGIFDNSRWLFQTFQMLFDNSRWLFQVF